METYGSKVVNGQNVPVIGLQSISPAAAMGPIYSGPGQSPLATIPTATGGTARVGSVAGSSGGGGGMGMVLVLIAMFAIGVLGLRYIHWGR